MHLSGKHHSLSLATVEFRPDKGGTRMIFTEAVAFLDETENAAARERGTAAHFDRIPSVLRSRNPSSQQGPQTGVCLLHDQP
jgi:hypothetical protein